ncbi:2-acylglycerophosphoethanolamine acyltransferase / acyl-acyl carrier protein synthetase [Rhodopirellula islandica]|uniref:2-acylglycerophosphoethanolamine acyltransferase / acyl-acyl carrier protein synthetase n=2 Tax=Rhodopirellula islandica TaxID=595434 RepID=A0A0J1BGI3_RHOIS|nr:2-acylglycerophosphoethanolamine acyltransferase / acyl-acyl carrier protein synthetase [Rhodopirellula islandica]
MDRFVKSVSFSLANSMFPLQDFIRTCRSRLFRRQAADSTGLDLSGGRLLAAALVTRRVLMRSGIVNDKDVMIGVLLPPSVAAVLANVSIGLAGKVVVNLNYTFTNERIQKCLDECAITHVLTSRQFLKRRPYEVEPQLVCMEDLMQQATWWDKSLSGLMAYCLPSTLLDRVLGLHCTSANDLMAVLFTSGTTADPKGVMLSHGNMAASIDAIRQRYRVRPDDVVLGILPIFHAFGFSATLWLPFGLNMTAVYHFDPFGTKAIAKLAKKYLATVLFATPTFLKVYQRRCPANAFPALDLAIVGGERLEPSTANSFAEKFGVTPAEGYGTTELSPWASVNVPVHRSFAPSQLFDRKGTVGRPVAGVQIRMVDPETRAEVPVGEQGLLLVRGANVMLGYLNLPDKTAEEMLDGWYNTGDFASVDEDGFVTIRGRQHRFSKIGGEIVPHAAVEEAIEELLRTNNANEERQVAITAIPDLNRGERLVVVHTPWRNTSAADITRKLSEANDLPAVWIPKPVDFIEVETIPLTSLGKLDLGELRRIAVQRDVDMNSIHIHAPENS